MDIITMSLGSSEYDPDLASLGIACDKLMMQVFCW